MTIDLLIHDIREIKISRKVETLVIEHSNLKSRISYVRKIYLKDINNKIFQISTFSDVKECLEIKYEKHNDIIIPKSNK